MTDFKTHTLVFISGELGEYESSSERQSVIEVAPIASGSSVIQIIE